MTKDSFNRKKNYSNTKIIQLDPLSERLSSAGFTGGASRSLLRKYKPETKSAFKQNKNFKVKNPDLISKKGQKDLRQQSLANKLIDNLKLRLKKDTQKSIDKYYKKTGVKVEPDQISISTGDKTFKTMNQVNFLKSKIISKYKRKN